MAKFVIECPSCGRFAGARNGFFAWKKIECSCGHVIDVRTDKMAGRECPHCGNTVVFDQSQGEKAKCPVCGESINTMAEQSKYEDISCAQCGIRLRVSKNSHTYTCPVCDFVNDIQERLTSEHIKKDGLASIIKYEGDGETLVWKHPVEDFNLGSQLIVHESQEAIFFRDGQALDLFGAGRYTLETQQLPLLEKVYKLPTDVEGTFHSEVYYINLSTQMGIKWGTDSKIRLFDPVSGLHIELGASGEFNIRVTNSRKLLLKLVGTTGGLEQAELWGSGNGRGFFRAMIITWVKSFLAQTIRENNINVLTIDEHLMMLSTALREKINSGLDEYGLTMPEFFVSCILTPDDDPNFKRMKEQYAEQYLLIRQEQIRKSEAEAMQARKTVESQTAAQLKIISAQGEAEALRIKKLAEAEAYRMQATAEAEEMRMKGYTYQQETSRQVGLEAMKNGLGGIDGSGALGDIAGLGMALGAMGGILGMTKDALSSTMDMSKQMGAQLDLVVNPQKVEQTWNCICGQKGNSSNFCSNCGMKKPNPTWTCSCGKTGNSGKFCENCGHKRGEE